MPSHSGDADTGSSSALPVPLMQTPATPSSAPIRLVVSNTTPLITLGEIGLLDALRQLYGTISLPIWVLRSGTKLAVWLASHRADDLRKQLPGREPAEPLAGCADDGESWLENASWRKIHAPTRD